MLALGLPPAQASALVHTAEVFTTSASAASHIYHRNVDWRMVTRLGVSGVLGGILGAWILSNLEVAAARRLVYAYLLLMGFYILWRSVRIASSPRTPSGWLMPLGLVAAFFVELGASPLEHLIPLVLGGVLAAPLGGWAVKQVWPRTLMVAVGLLIVALSTFQLARTF